ncbi:MAG: hypothetical protein RLZZ258_1389 [Actinomycetota bacterium]|jgi:DNA-binding LacI/PurR family transcriptional regulator
MNNVTMEDVAKAAGVSRSHVSLAYRDAYGIKPDVRDHILAVGKKLGYRPNRIASQLAGKSSGSIGIYLQDLHNDFFADIYDGVREVTEPLGKHLVLAVGHTDGTRDAQALETLLESRVDVVIAAGLMLSDKELSQFTTKVSLVSVARIVKKADNVYSDNFSGATKATQHLIALGHKKLMFLANPQSDGYTDRLRGYEEAMKLANLEPIVVQGSYERRENQEIATAILSGHDRPSAIFAHNDQAALGVMDAIITQGLRPGVDISVIGYDNSTLSQSPSSALSTVDIHGFELGTKAANVALQRMNGELSRTITEYVEPTLVTRSTSGKMY